MSAVRAAAAAATAPATAAFALGGAFSRAGRFRVPKLSAIATVWMLLAAATVLVRASVAQEPSEPPESQPSPSAERPAAKSPTRKSAPAKGQEPAAAAQPLSGMARARGLAVLRRHAERSRGVKVLAADYVQRRTTSLRKRPLVSSGAFLFASQPGCVVFRATKPRVSTVRLTATSYEVFRPSRKRLERFRLDAPELSEGLFAALRGDAQRLERDFELVGCTSVELPAKPAQEAGLAGIKSGVRLVLVPKVAAVRERLRDLELTFVGDGEQLRSIAYCDRAGDRVEIELRKQRQNPADAPSAKLAVPEGTRVLEHGPRDR
ncbi:MAG: outer membrane lipoprotein carrier protein LolA [Planctomycetota bacterium]